MRFKWKGENNSTTLNKTHSILKFKANWMAIQCFDLLALDSQAHHQEILSQQQDLIIATQSAQALLDKQAEVLSPAEKDKLQRDIKELKGRYEASLTQAEAADEAGPDCPGGASEVQGGFWGV